MSDGVMDDPMGSSWSMGVAMLVLGKFGLVWSWAILLDQRPDGPIPDEISGTRTGTTWDRLYQSGPSPDPVQMVQLFISFHFSSYNACEGHIPSATQSPLPDVLSSSVCPLHHQPHEMYVSHLGVLLCMSVGGS